MFYYNHYKSSIFSRLLNCHRHELKRKFFWFIFIIILTFALVLLTAKFASSANLDNLKDINYEHISVVLEDEYFQTMYYRIIELAPFLPSKTAMDYTSWFIKYSKELDLDPFLPLHIAYRESKLHTEPEYDTGSGAGLMQIIFGSHRNLMYELGINSRRELFTNPEKNIQAGCRILAMSYYQFSTINGALYLTSSYNYKLRQENLNKKQFEKDIIGKIRNFNIEYEQFDVDPLLSISNIFQSLLPQHTSVTFNYLIN